MKHEIVIYAKLFGLAEDADGARTYGGLKLGLGTYEYSEEPPTYEERIQSIDKAKFLGFLGLTDEFEPGDLEFISPEEYARDFGEDEEDE